MKTYYFLIECRRPSGWVSIEACCISDGWAVKDRPYDFIMRSVMPTILSRSGSELEDFRVRQVTRSEYDIDEQKFSKNTPGE